MPTPVSPPFPKEGQGWFVIFIWFTLFYRRNSALQPIDNQDDTFWLPKDGISGPKRASPAMQEVPFRNAKGHLLKPGTRHTAQSKADQHRSKSSATDSGSRSPNGSSPHAGNALPLPCRWFSQASAQSSVCSWSSPWQRRDGRDRAHGRQGGCAACCQAHGQPLRHGFRHDD